MEFRIRKITEGNEFGFEVTDLGTTNKEWFVTWKQVVEYLAQRVGEQTV